MEFGIEHIMCNSFSAQHSGKQFGSVNINGTHQHWLLFCMGCLNSLHHSPVFFLFGHVDGIIQIYSGYRFIGGNLNNIHSVDIPEFLLLSKSRSGHTAFFLKFIEKVLEGNRCQCLAFPAYLHMFLGLNSLMQTIRVTPPRHDTSGKLIYNEYLIVLHYVILIAEHKVMSPQCQNNIVLDLQILGICQVLNVEKLLHFLDTLLSQVDNLILFIDNKITGLYNFFAHDCGHLGHLSAGLTSLQLTSQNVTDFVKLRGFATLTRDDQRSSGLIN